MKVVHVLNAKLAAVFFNAIVESDDAIMIMW